MSQKGTRPRATNTSAGRPRTRCNGSTFGTIRPAPAYAATNDTIMVALDGRTGVPHWRIGSPMPGASIFTTSAPKSAKRDQTHRPEKNDNAKKEYDKNSAKGKKKVLTTSSEQIGSISDEQTVISNEASHNNNEVSVTFTQPDTRDKETIAEIANPGIPDKETAPLIASPDVSRQNIVKTINTTKDAAPSATKSKKVRTKGRTPDGKKDRHRKRK